MDFEQQKEKLIFRIKENCNSYFVRLLTHERQDIIDRANEIVHVKQVVSYLVNVHEFSESQVNSFSKFRNPMAVLISHYPDIPEKASRNDYKFYPLVTDAEPPEPLRRFMNVDVLQSLQAIMKQVTFSYQSDFEYNRKHILKVVGAENPEHKNLLWLCRENGTHLHTERDVFIKGTNAYNNIQFYHHDCLSEKAVLYSIEITGMKNGVVRGNLYERDRHQYAELAARGASPYTDITVTCSDGHIQKMPHTEYDGYVARDLKDLHGTILEVRNEAEDESVVQGALHWEQERREVLPKGRFDAHIEKLADQRIEAEADRIQGTFQNLTEPNSPNKTHYMVAISPAFMQTAGTRDMDCLLDKLAAALKNDTVHFCGAKGEKGLFCFMKADPITQEHKPSIKEQLAAPPQKSDKPPTKPKEKEVR